MSISQDTRERVRTLCDYRCGYCGTEEWQAGGQLEIEHFRPRSSGWFHINWLQLNRPQLIIARQRRGRLIANRTAEQEYQHIITQLRTENAQQAQEITTLRALIAQLRKQK